MNQYKSLAFAALAAAALLAGQAFATPCPVSPVAAAGQMQGSPVCIAPYGLDGPATGLAGILAPYDNTANPNGIFTAGSPSIDPYTQQAQKGLWSISGSSGSISTIVLQIAAFANKDTFGIFDPNTGNTLALFTNGTNGSQVALSSYTGGYYAVNFGPKVYLGTTNQFGFFLTTPAGDTFYSVPSMNEAGGTLYPDGTPHMVAYQGNDKSTIRPMDGLSGGLFQSGEFILAWEDLPFDRSDFDYNDFVVMVESVHPVPEPAVLGMFGLGVLLIGTAAGLNRRRRPQRI